MGAMAQRLTACLLCCLLVGTLQANAKVATKTTHEVSELTYDAIQGAINDAADNDVIQLPAGQLELDASLGQFFQITKPLQLKGVAGATVITSVENLSSDRKKQAAPSTASSVTVPTSCLYFGFAILEICIPELTRRSDNSTTVRRVEATTDPIMVDGITFVHSATGSSSVSGSDSYKGIAVVLSGPASSNLGFSSITKCDFYDMDVGVELFAAENWNIEGNVFSGAPRGVWLNSKQPVKTPLGLNITGNNFTE